MRIRQETDMERLSQGGVTAPKGFKAASAAAGIKYQGRTDMAMVMSEAPCVCAGTYTSNVVKAACVLWDKEITENSEERHAETYRSGDKSVIFRYVYCSEYTEEYPDFN